MIEHQIPGQTYAMPLEKYLRRAWPMMPGYVLRDALKKKDVRINGTKCGANDVVSGGDILNLYIQDKWIRPDPEILWEDGRLIIAVKPQGLPVDVDQEGVGADTLLSRLENRYPRVRLCHRLDAATGGIVMAALDEIIYQQALEAFRNHGMGVRKEYHALALGRFKNNEGTLHAWLRKDATKAKVQVTHREVPGAKPIETRYRVVEAAGKGLYAVKLEPVTGRTHQLRAHMADYGHPLLGDDRYGDRVANKQYPGQKLCLWHERLTIPQTSPLKDYAGKIFEKSAPDWLK